MAVSLAIKSGRLVKCIVRDQHGRPKISDPVLADREWDANTDLTKAPAFVKDAAAARAAPVDAPDGDDPDGPSDLAAATERLKSAQADLAELKRDTERGTLVLASEVKRKLDEVFSACKTRLLAIPSRARQALPHMPNADVVVIEDLVREALEDLAS